MKATSSVSEQCGNRLQVHRGLVLALGTPGTHTMLFLVSSDSLHFWKIFTWLGLWTDGPRLFRQTVLPEHRLPPWGPKQDSRESCSSSPGITWQPSALDFSSSSICVRRQLLSLSIGNLPQSPGKEGCAATPNHKLKMIP